MRPFELRGDGVLLAIPTVDDIDAITEICQDDEILRWTTLPDPYTRDDAERFLREIATPGWESGSNLTWAVRDPEDRSVLGMVGLHLKGGAGSGEVGFWLAPGARGRGVMTTAVRLVCEYGLDPDGHGLDRVVWRASVGNWASRRVAWRLGFRIEGTIRKDLLKRGERVDTWMGTLLAGDAMKPVGRWLGVPALTGSKVACGGSPIPTRMRLSKPAPTRSRAAGSVGCPIHIPARWRSTTSGRARTITPPAGRCIGPRRLVDGTTGKERTAARRSGRSP